MMNDFNANGLQKFDFVERMPGGAFVCRTDGEMELLFVNQHIVNLFECDDYDDFMQFVGKQYSGMVGRTQFQSIEKELEMQIREKKQNGGRLFYHIMTKKGNVYLAEEHWALAQDPELGELYYSFLISREYESAGTDYDSVTGLYGKKRFDAYCTNVIHQFGGKDDFKYAIVYLNLVNFKLLNLNRGIAEGDACLKAVADSLSHVFEDAFLARLSDDHYGIFEPYDGIEEKMEAFRAYFKEHYEERYGVIAKWGIYGFVPSPEFDVEKALSYAKIACDHVKYLSGVYGACYTEQLAKQRSLAEHLVRNFDEALEKGWIQVYYQPVVRTITGQLCGMESLVRWIDPEFGFIMPNDFISVLEESRQIHKLDSFVVEKVCERHAIRLKEGRPVVPVSVNFSRLDFVLCDMLQVVEAAVEKYDIPRDYVHVEITESMIASDEELMRNVIDGFRAAGYEIWMDDFGSGYSSLTVLKDYQFDMLKLDMKFLSNFTDKSRDIMRSAIIMAKDLGIKTLAEGVETTEQLEYLKQIGCDQIQGYYYGKPTHIGSIDKLLRERNISVETRKWRHFYEVASFNVKATEIPLEIIEDDGKSFRTLFMNDAYREQIRVGSVSLEEIDRKIYHTASPLLAKYREFAEQIKRTGKSETFYYTNSGTYLCFRGQAIAQNQGRAIIKGSIYNVTADQNHNTQVRLDSKLRTLNLLFRVILHADLKNQTLTPLLGTSPNMQTQQILREKISDNNALFAENNIFPTERARYRKFMDFSTAKERVERTAFGYVSDIFRIKQQDGNYRMAEVTLMMIPGTDGSEYLYCVKPYTPYVPREEEGVEGFLFESPGISEKKLGQEEMIRFLWDSLLWNSNVKFFWKDGDRRFLGASQAFLDYFGMDSVDELLGKTDEDMRWHVNDVTYREEEIAILQRGIHTKVTPGQVISKGVIRNVVSSKMPVYKNGTIVGLIGLFYDKDQEISLVNQELTGIRKDPATDLMDAHAYVDAMIDYAMQYHDRRRNYGVILIRNTRHERIMSTYGEELSRAVLREMGRRIVDVMGKSCVIARAKEAIFCVLSYVDDETEFIEKAGLIKNRLNNLNTVEGNSVTVRTRVSVKIRSWAGITDENIYDTALREVMAEETE